ncbi:MAG: IS21 family transposase [Sporocytophaga sp.]|nr:IS21 family transposase [Sporocytophaga sp.]
MNVYLAKLMMYHEVHRMSREGYSTSRISQYLVLNRRTVARYLSMSEQEYEAFLIEQVDRKKVLLPYENFTKDRLERYQDTSAAQMHDWLKECYPDFPQVSQKTVFNFVHWVRDKYNLPRIKPERQYHPVEECAYGKQAQVDFGEYNMRTSAGKRVKVFFFTFVLSRSRYKFVWFTDQCFTAEVAVKAHELAFDYMQGVPDEIVYDQDKVFIVSENAGEIILTNVFRSYTSSKPFTVHFCRKSDPESKGKVENVVKYVKQNFLYNRTFYNIETLNDEAMGWLGRTANMLPHAFTQNAPYSEWIIEQDFLKPHLAHVPKAAPLASVYTVRKDNSISYKSNLYSLPLGSYKGRGTVVSVYTEADILIIFDQSGTELCRHKIVAGKGLKVFNTDHKRDKSSAINEMIDQLAILLPDPVQGKNWLNLIKTDKPRYIRDQLIIIRDTIQSTETILVQKAMDYCVENKITSAIDFKAIIAHYLQTERQNEAEERA